MKIPTEEQLSKSGDYGADPETLCANFKRGCNGVTNGAVNGRLTLCSDCAADLTRETEQRRAAQASDRAKAELFADQPALPPINAADWRNFEGRAK